MLFRSYPEKQLPLFIANALADRPIPVYGDGTNTRDWIYVTDHATALEALLQAPAEVVVGEVFNVGAAEEYSILQNARIILHALGKPESLLTFVPDRLGHVRRHAVDSTKLQRTLGWQPQVGYVEGIQQTIRWYQHNQAWLQTVLERKDSFLDGALALGSK